LGDVGVRQELLVCAPEDALGMGYEVDCGYILLGRSPACDYDAEACFDGVVLSSEHYISRRVFFIGYEVRVLRGFVLLGVGEDERSVRGSSESDRGMCV